ncbi:hypothetical protein HRI_004659700 [Hibiscus trionum]|uniref:Uncharacterized protein n=1 Tax=Hibiscus trionum TaxID=183268 RepID=A0A9W7J8D5_HIBTR|nr:hypothetical protein HRI_004659700 [Hibiscus trionum]
MKQPNTAAPAITASLERSLRNCSLNHESCAKEEDDDNKVPNGVVSEATLEELNSRMSLPKLAEHGGDFSSSDGDDSWCDSEDYSSSGSSPSRDYNDRHRGVPEEEKDDVLVVAGCRSCYMYFMVPKKAEGCPKCNGHLVRFDGSHGSSSSPP